MVVADGPKIFDVQWIWERIFVFLEKDFCFQVFGDYISFRFYAKYIWKKCCKKFFERIFWAHTPFKQYQNTSGCSTAYHQWPLTLVIYQQYRMTRLLQTLLMDF